MIKLSKRLRAAADMVIPGSRLADVGTDHGWVPIYLVQSGAVPSALAMDIGRGPLERAREHIEENGLSDRIECRLSDGLTAYESGECDTVLIAGMGGELIIDILTKGRGKLTDGMQLILSPHTHVELVRKYIDACGYEMKDEICVYDEGKYYFLMDVRVGEGCSSGEMCEDGHCKDTVNDVAHGATNYTYDISRILLAKKDPIYRDYLGVQLGKYRNILDNAGLGNERRGEIENICRHYSDAYEHMQM